MLRQLRLCLTHQDDCNAQAKQKSDYAEEDVKQRTHNA